MEKQFFIDTFNPTADVLEKLERYVDLLTEEQKIMNLVSDNSLSTIWSRHILDSAQVLNHIEIGSGKFILDFGSGAGFPGLVLAIMDQRLKVYLVESEGRKCDFLNKIASVCELNVTIHNERIEKIAPFNVDFITARALASLDKLLEYARPFMGRKTKCLFLKGKKADIEVKEALKKWTFQLEKYTSISSDEGQILKISQVKKK